MYWAGLGASGLASRGVRDFCRRNGSLGGYFGESEPTELMFGTEWEWGGARDGGGVKKRGLGSSQSL